MQSMPDLVRRKFQILSEAEEKLLVDMEQGKDESIFDESTRVEYVKNKISADLLRFIYLRANTEDFPTVPRISRAYISGNFDLQNLTINSPIRFTSCIFEHAINLIDSVIKKGIFLQGSETPGILANRVVVSGPVLLRHGFQSTGTVNFSGAKIESDFDLRGAYFLHSKKKDCINLESAVIDGNLILSKGPTNPIVHEEEGEEQANEKKNEGTEGSKFIGRVNITKAIIKGNLKCSGSSFEKGESDTYALDFYNSRIYGDCFLDYIELTGGISLWGATISGDIHLHGSTFKKFQSTYPAQGAQTAIPKKKTSDNKIEHTGAEEAEESIDIDLSADGLTVEGAIYLHNIKFSSENGESYYFSFNHARAETIADDMQSWSDRIDIDGFHYKTISKDPSRIKSGSDISDRRLGTFGTVDHKKRIEWLEKQRPKEIDYVIPQPYNYLCKLLKTFRLNWLAVIIEKKYSISSYITIYGCILQKCLKFFRCVLSQEYIEERNARIERKHTVRAFMPQPWKHLYSVLWHMGHQREAVEIGYELQRKLQKNDFSIFRFLYRALAGFGYRPWRLALWMIVAWIGCAIFYWAAALPPHNVFSPTNPLIFQNQAYASCIPQSLGKKHGFLEETNPKQKMRFNIKNPQRIF